MLNYCRLSFDTDNDKVKTVRVPDPDVNQAAGVFTAAANKMISANIFDLKGALLKGIRRIDNFVIDRNILIK